RPVIPRACDPQLGMAAVIDPLVEEPGEIPPRLLLERAAQVRGLDRPERVALQVALEGAPPGRVPRECAKHVEHAGALLVEVPVEERRRIVPSRLDERSPVVLAVL